MNKVREFRKEEAVAQDNTQIKSALRSQPSTPGRLVKLNAIAESVADTKAKVEVKEEICGSESDKFET